MSTTRQPTIVPVDRLAVMMSEGVRPQVIDVRSANEFATGHLPGAINVPMETIASRIKDFDLSAPTIFVCQSGRRAGMVCEQTSHLFADASVLEGGTEAWKSQGRPVVAVTASSWSLERQVRLGAGLLVLIGVTLSLLVHPAWIGLSAFVGAGLTFAGFTNICLMASLLAKLPWNRSKATCVLPTGVRS